LFGTTRSKFPFSRHDTVYFGIGGQVAEVAGSVIAFAS
jgi:hypothetical protein